MAEDTSPQSKRINEKLMASGLLTGQGTYEWFEIHNGFAVEDVFKKYLK